jgi:hypothetical protein
VRVVEVNPKASSLRIEKLPSAPPRHLASVCSLNLYLSVFCRVKEMNDE